MTVKRGQTWIYLNTCTLLGSFNTMAYLHDRPVGYYHLRPGLSVFPTRLATRPLPSSSYDGGSCSLLTYILRRCNGGGLCYAPLDDACGLADPAGHPLAGRFADSCRLQRHACRAYSRVNPWTPRGRRLTRCVECSLRPALYWGQKKIKNSLAWVQWVGQLVHVVL